MNSFDPLSVHTNYLRTTPMKLAFYPLRNFQQWRMEVGVKLRELMGDEPERVPANLRVEYEKSTDLYKDTRYVFSSEANCEVPCHPADAKNKARDRFR